MIAITQTLAETIAALKSGLRTAPDIGQVLRGRNGKPIGRDGAHVRIRILRERGLVKLTKHPRSKVFNQYAYTGKKFKLKPERKFDYSARYIQANFHPYFDTVTKLIPPATHGAPSNYVRIMA